MKVWAQIWPPQYLPPPTPTLPLSLAGGQCPLLTTLFFFLLSIVAAISLQMSGCTTFLWAQVTNKETESPKMRGKCRQPGGLAAKTESLSSPPHQLLSCSFACHSPLWVAALCHNHHQLPGPAFLRPRVTFRTTECLRSEILSAPCSDQQGRGLLCSTTSV